jgi:hypothetical protein
MNITRKQLKLMEFAEEVLAMLEADKEWSADTLDDLGLLAMNMGLATTNEDGEFVAKEEFTG